jgi:hypothetical protein
MRAPDPPLLTDTPGPPYRLHAGRVVSLAVAVVGGVILALHAPLAAAILVAAPIAIVFLGFPLQVWRFAPVIRPDPVAEIADDDPAIPRALRDARDAAAPALEAAGFRAAGHVRVDGGGGAAPVFAAGWVDEAGGRATLACAGGNAAPPRLDVATRFADGAAVGVTTDAGAVLPGIVPPSETLQLPDDPPATLAVEAHRRLVARWRAAHPAAEVAMPEATLHAMLAAGALRGDGTPAPSLWHRALPDGGARLTLAGAFAATWLSVPPLAGARRRHVRRRADATLAALGLEAPARPRGEVRAGRVAAGGALVALATLVAPAGAALGAAGIMTLRSIARGFERPVTRGEIAAGAVVGAGLALAALDAWVVPLRLIELGLGGASSVAAALAALLVGAGAALALAGVPPEPARPAAVPALPS